MQRTRSCGVQAWALALLVLLGCATAAAAQSREQEHVEYWRTHYQELRPTEDASRRAQTSSTSTLFMVGKSGKVIVRFEKERVFSMSVV